MNPETITRLKSAWTDRLVMVKPGSRAELVRFEDQVGRVVTVNWSGRAVVDFADGAWYDITDFESILIDATDEAKKASFDASANSAQPHPVRQG